ncbi:hypothetical protein BS78_05G141100 [Paspalum vaginatum]|nr:hypothetical protein BS78_05G141100 [Paspalum vaginatum]
MEVVRNNHSKEPAALVLPMHRVGNKARMTTSTAGLPVYFYASARARQGAVAAASPPPPGSCKAEASMHGSEEGGDGSGGAAAVLFMRRNGASRLLPCFMSCVV